MSIIYVVNYLIWFWDEYFKVSCLIRFWDKYEGNCSYYKVKLTKYICLIYYVNFIAINEQWYKFIVRNQEISSENWDENLAMKDLEDTYFVLSYFDI